MAIAKKVVDSFWSKLDKRGDDECWEWQACVIKDGYGLIWNGSTRERAHRFSWRLHNGEIPEGLGVLHKCDNRKCMNPSHLFLGTNQDNIDDKMRKWRHKYGEGHPNSKIKDRDVLAIREYNASGMLSQRDLAKIFGISQPAIGQITRRATWKHVL